MLMKRKKNARIMPRHARMAISEYIARFTRVCSIIYKFLFYVSIKSLKESILPE
jgi:hypothetical protein